MNWYGLQFGGRQRTAADLQFDRRRRNALGL